MKKILIIAGLVAVVIAGVFVVRSKTDVTQQGSPDSIGFDRSNSDVLGFTGREFNQISSRSSNGILKSSPGRVFAIEVTSDSTTQRYFQLFDTRDAIVPSRAASLSALWLYKASLSYQYQPLRTVGAWQKFASQSLVFSVPIPPSTASTSLSTVRIDSSMFAPAKNFLNGILWGISNSFGAYSSTSLGNQGTKYFVRIIYE